MQAKQKCVSRDSLWCSCNELLVLSLFPSLTRMHLLSRFRLNAINSMLISLHLPSSVLLCHFLIDNLCACWFCLVIFNTHVLKPQPSVSLARIPVRTKTWSLLLCEAARTHHRPCWCCTAGRAEWLLLLGVPPRGPGALLWALPARLPC